MCKTPSDVQTGKLQFKQRINRKAVAAVCLANCAHFYAICSIFSYAGFLAVDCGWAADEDQAGFAAGLLPTALIMGRLPTSIFWGHAADRYGRRPSLACAMLAVTFGNLLFGISTNLYLALAARFVFLGAANGWVSLMGLLCHDLGGTTQQAQVFSWVISAGSIVATLGPALGGFTYAKLGSTYPALPPSLIGSGLGVTAIVTTLCWLPETRPGQPGKSGSTTSTTADSSASTKGAPDAVSTPTATPPSLWALLCLRPMPLAVILRAGHGLALFAVFDVVPLWAIASVGSGGLAMSEEEVGVMLAGSAIGQFLYTSLAMGKLCNRMGTRTSFSTGCYVAGVCLILVPLLPLALPAAAPRPASIALISFVYCVYGCSMLTAGTGAVGMTTNLCARHPERSGSLNGAVALAEGCGKGLGPAIAAPLFAVAIASRPANSTAGPSGAILVFGAFALLFVGLGLGGALLPRSVDTEGQGDDAVTMTEPQRSQQPAVKGPRTRGGDLQLMPVVASARSLGSEAFQRLEEEEKV